MYKVIKFTNIRIFGVCGILTLTLSFGKDIDIASANPGAQLIQQRDHTLRCVHSWVDVPIWYIDFNPFTYVYICIYVSHIWQVKDSGTVSLMLNYRLTGLEWFNLI